MWESLRRLSMLPPETEVFPAHEYSPLKQSTIGRERVGNFAMRTRKEDFIRM